MLWRHPSVPGTDQFAAAADRSGLDSGGVVYTMTNAETGNEILVSGTQISGLEAETAGRLRDDLIASAKLKLK